MRIALERAGFQVEIVADGRDVIHAINADPDAYCCVLLDMLLPTIHGSSIITHIARTAPRVAVVAVTGYPDRVLFADPSDRHVVKAIFPKPVDPVDVAAYVKSRCDRLSKQDSSASPSTE